MFRPVTVERDIAPVLATGAVRKIGALSLGAFAAGAMALGALAIGALAVGRLAVGRARIKRLEIDELVVRRLRVIEGLETPAKPGPDVQASRADL